ncbi:BcepGomrgp65 [Burkholderia phage BcepGomr]|uniref:BcepGomrgp65 n=1 Tax=Burkholderia phage BcepGomr TaxID=437329 RepID=UPI000150354D|nr:BcepGomrgp65 [Burkholderia phage BcepGomr]ABP63636.1 BcepGomrgp65 [Burkholderia phage BcepGomr]
MAYATNLAAINAARKAHGESYIHMTSIIKLDGEWHVQMAQPRISDPINSIRDEREGAFAFPRSAEATPAEASAIAAFFASRAATSAPVEMPDDEMRAAQQEADRIANAQASEQQLPNGKVWVRQSSVLKPTKMVWAIADEMNAAAREAGKEAPSRKEVQEECVRRGIASGTARTQYQAWKAANDATSKNAALAAELSAKLNGKA